MAAVAVQSAGAAGVATAAAAPSVPSFAQTIHPAPAAQAPLGEFAATLTFTVATISPEVVTAATGNFLTITGTMTNAGDQTVGNLDLRFQRGDAISDVAGVRSELTDPGQPIAILTAKVPHSGTLAPGATGPFSATVKIAGGGADSLAIATRGVYPIMLNFNGDLGDGDEVFHARVGELHLLTTVVSVPIVPADTAASGTAPAGSGTSAAGGAGSQPPTRVPPVASSPIPITMLWPVVDRPHLGLDGVFLDDSLTDAISAGGRLAGLLDRLDGTDLGPGAITMVIDPELLDELSRMSAGYRVLAAPGRPQAPLTPTSRATGSSVSGSGAATTHSAGNPGVGPPAPTTSTGNPTTSTTATSPPATVFGRGQQAAVVFLRRLRSAAAKHPVLLLPYSDPDVLALVGTDLVGQLRPLAAKGRQLAAHLLGRAGTTELLTTTAYPVDGLADGPALLALAKSGYRTAVLDTASVQESGVAGAVSLPLGGGSTIDAAVNDSDLLAPITALTTPQSGASADTGTGPSTVLQLNALAALMAEHSFDGSATALVLLPDRQWTSAAWPGLPTFARLSRQLAGGKVVAGTTVEAIAASSATDATAQLPANPPAPLDAPYVRRVQSDRDQIRQMSAALAQNTEGSSGQPDPADLLDSLDDSFNRVFSSALRSDPAFGLSVVSTVESTIASVRGGVTIRSPGQSYTLASSSSPLLLTVQNTLPYAVKIKVVITGGDRTGLKVVQPEQQTIPAGRSQQFKILTQVSRSGNFQVQARLVGPDGATWSPPSQITLSSSAYGTVTIVIIVVAGAVLLLMVIVRIRQQWRSRTTRLAEENGTGAQPGDEPTLDSIVGSAEAESDADARAETRAAAEAGATATARAGSDRGGTDQS